MQNKKFYVVFALIITLAFSTKVFASLTFTTDAITGTAASTIDVGANALSLQTTNNGNIVLGTGKLGIGTTNPLSLIDQQLSFDFVNRGGKVISLGGTDWNIDNISSNLQLTSSSDIASTYSYNIANLENYEIPASVTTDLSKLFLRVRSLYIKNSTSGKSPLLFADSVDLENRPTGSSAQTIYGQSAGVTNYATASVSSIYGNNTSVLHYGPGAATSLYGNNTSGIASAYYNNTSATSTYGISVTGRVEGYGAYTGSATNVYGIDSLASSAANNTSTSTATTAYGVRARTYARSVTSTATSTIGTGYGLYASVGAYGHATNASMTNAYGVYVTNGIVGGSPLGNVTNNYGLYIENQTQGATLNYALYSAGGTNYFGGSVGVGIATPNVNAILDVSSTTKAFMPPRMTTAQRDAIASPTAGMVIYNSTTNKLNVYTTAWETITSAI
jgi:hypothetical protein